MSTFIQDIRYGFRMLLKRPGLSLVAALTLALGISANTAIFSGVNTFILRPLPVPEPGKLVRVFETSEGHDDFDNFSYPDYKDYRDQNNVFESIAVMDMRQAALSKENQNDVIWGEVISGNYFDVMKVKPELGRTFTPEEDKTPNKDAVIVISHSLWERRFESDKSIIGKTMTLNGATFTIIGIAPKGFYGSKFGLSLDFWVPMMMSDAMRTFSGALTDRGSTWLESVARLKPGVSIEQAQAEMNTIAQRINQTYPNDRSPKTRIAVVSEIDGRYGDVSKVFKLASQMAMFVVGLILLIACANVANLLLARSAERQKEIGVRIALGAGRFRLLRQLLTESVMLSLIGGVFGLLLAYWMTDMMKVFIPALQYNFMPDLFQPDLRVLIFCFAISLLTGIVFGLAPALQSTKTDVVPILKGESGTLLRKTRRFSMKNLLVVSQITLSLVVLVCGGLFIKSFRNAQKIDPGFKTSNVVLLSLAPDLIGYDDDKCRKFYAQLTERVETLPGVKSASLIQRMPLSDGSNSVGPIVKEGDPQPKAGEGIGAPTTEVAPKFFSTLEIPLLAGRDFDSRDKIDSPQVAVINDTMAKRFWGSTENALGKRFTIGDGKNFTEVIGVVKTGKYRQLSENPRSFMFRALSQRSGRNFQLVVTGTNDPLNLVSAIRQEIRSMDALMPVYGVKTMQEHLSWTFWGIQMGASLALAFGVMALLLAASGLYSLMAYAVSQRTREIGIRMALGARQQDVLTLITGQGMRLVLAGIVIGLLASFAVTRLLVSLLFGVSATDIWTFAAICLLLIVVALIACYIPARRATKIDPMKALRYD